jgi:adenylosuccinate lyase
MTLTSLTALSPLDGRYASKVNGLREILSEFGLIRCRVQAEVAWLKGLASLGVKQLPPLSNKAVKQLDQWVEKFSVKDAQRIKDIEATTNHDVKAVEYFLKE